MNGTRAAWPAGASARVARALGEAAGAGAAPAAGMAATLAVRRLGAALGFLPFGVGPWGGRPLAAAVVQALAVGVLARAGGVEGTGTRARTRRTVWALGAAALAPPALALYTLGVAGDADAGVGLRLFGAALAAGACTWRLATAAYRCSALATPVALCGWGLLLVEVLRWTPPPCAPPVAEAATCAWPAPVAWARARARGDARAAQTLQAWAAARGAEAEVLASLAPLRARRGRALPPAAPAGAAEDALPGAAGGAFACADLAATARGPGGSLTNAATRRLQLALAPRRTGVWAPVGTLDVVFAGDAAGPVLRGRSAMTLLPWLPAGAGCAALALCARGAPGTSAQAVRRANGADADELFPGDAVDLGANDPTLGKTGRADPHARTTANRPDADGAAACGRAPPPAPRGGAAAEGDALGCPPGWPQVRLARPGPGPWTVRLRGTWLLADATCVPAASLRKPAP